MFNSKIVDGKIVYDIDEATSRKMLSLAKESLVNTYPKSGDGYAVTLLTKRSGIDTVVIVEEGSKIKQIPISKLMPYPWPDKPLK